MKSILRKIALTLSAIMLSGGLTFVAAAPAVYAQCDSGVGKGVSLTTEDGGCTDDGTGENSLSGVIKRVIDIFSIVVGAVSVIMIIIGGFRYVVSNGDSNGVSGAKNTILYAIVGLVIVIFAQVIVRFVLTNVSPQ
ncbi:MAG: pilin [Candidatus Saccharimonadales bacterium]